ncbi:MAG: hypothetical protein WCO63_15150 [Bacteroidota bacterium]
MKQLSLVLLLFTMFGIHFTISAQGDLLVSPMRVVFDSKKQKEELNLVNIGKDTAMYSVSFLQYNMTEDGSFIIIDKPDSGQYFAEPYLRYFPRTVTLAPRESQTIRIQWRKTSDMPEGEFRSHLYFRAEKNVKPLGMEQSKKDSNQLSVSLTPIYGISIPTIIRNGDFKVSASLSDLKISTTDDTIPELRLTIHRSGKISVYGDLYVDYVSPSGKSTQIGYTRGIAVYTNISKRNCALKLHPGKDVNFKAGKLKVKYTSSKDVPYVLYAEQELGIN